MANPKTMAPYIVVQGAAEAIDFYREAFGAEELFRLVDPTDGRIGHAELRFGDARLMLADEFPDFGALSPVSLGGSPAKLHITVADVDATVAKAAGLGATVLRPVKEEFYGERTGLIEDPFGFAWFVATPVETVTPDEMQRRWNAATEA